jgi:hypothetical protein
MIEITKVAMHQYGSGCRRPWFLFALPRLGPFRYAALEAYNRECGRNDGREPPAEKRGSVCEEQVPGDFGVTA